jgi:formylglycine-generating enzyme required for sulfatase activity
MAIVPDDSGIIDTVPGLDPGIEAMVLNQDIGFVAEGQEAVIKLNAVLFARYGVVSGKIKIVSEDAVGAVHRCLQDGDMNQTTTRIPFPWQVNFAICHLQRRMMAALLGCAVALTVGSCADEDSRREKSPSLTYSAHNIWAPGAVIRDCGSICPELVVIPAERFGGQQEAIGEFAIGKYETTAEEFRAFVAETGYSPTLKCLFPQVLAEEDSWENSTFFKYRPSDRDPAVCVTWHAANEYVKWLSKKTGRDYRLPSEHIWEYAATGRTKPRFFWGLGSVCDYANGYDATTAGEQWTSIYLGSYPCTDGYAYIAPVGSFKPNGFGIYDVAGNVVELTSTCFTPGVNDNPESSDANEECGDFVVRGGHWLSPLNGLSIDSRGKSRWNSRSVFVGFRVIRLRMPNE